MICDATVSKRWPSYSVNYLKLFIWIIVSLTLVGLTLFCIYSQQPKHPKDLRLLLLSDDF